MGRSCSRKEKEEYEKQFIDSNESILVVNKGTSCARSLIEES